MKLLRVNLYEKRAESEGTQCRQVEKSEEMCKEGLDVGGKPRECEVLKTMKYSQKEKVNNGVKHYGGVKLRNGPVD